MRLRRIGTALALVLVVAPMLACAGRIQEIAKKAQEEAAKNMQDEAELKQIHRAWSDYLTKNQGKAPSRAEDLFPYLGGPNSPAAQALKSGKFVFYYDVRISDMTTGGDSVGTARTVLAYAAKVPTSDGMALMADGTVKLMTRAEFAMLGQLGHDKKASDYKKVRQPGK
jgi:hypothetical protein